MQRSDPLLLSIRLMSALAVCLCIPLAGVAQPLPAATPEAVGMSTPRFELLHTMLRQHVDDGRIPGLVAGVVRDGRLVYLESMGSQVLGESDMRDDSIFEIRSMSKGVTSLAVMQLVEQGSLSLTDPLSRYIPAFADTPVFIDPDNPDDSATRAPSRQLTIEDLLLNTGGISHRFGELYASRGVRSRADTLEQMMEKIAAVPLMADPGTEWIYSESATILGRVVEIVSGQAFDDYLEQHIFEPLGMVDTAFYVPAGKVDRLARVYQISRDDGALTRAPDMEVPITTDPPLLEGAAGLVSTVPDYLRFMQAFLNGGELDGRRVLSEDLIAEMIRNQIPEHAMPIALGGPMLDVGWGYGFTVVTNPAASSYAVNMGEFGWNGSLGTFSWADPQTGTIAVLMMQIAPAGAYSLSGKFKTMVAQTIIDQ